MRGEPAIGPDGLRTFPFGIDWAGRRSPHASSVGIVMRTRNRPLLLRRALESVADQTFDDWHLVVVNHAGDPGPVDEAVEAISPRVKGKIEVVHLDDGGGMERASNAGLDRLDASYVAVHDDDDSWLPEFLARTVAFLDDDAHQSYGGVVTHGIKRWERVTGDEVEHIIDEDLDGVTGHLDAQRLFGWNRFLPINFLVRSAVFDVVGRFNEDLPVIGDWDFHLRVAAVTDIGFIPERLARYHLRVEGDHLNTITAGVDRHLDVDARVRAAMLRRYLDADPSRLGLLVALSHDDEMARRLGERVREVVELIDWRTHHTGNRINDAHDRIIAMDARLSAVEAAVAGITGVADGVRDANASLDAIHRRIDALEGPVGEIRADTARIRKAMSVLGSPIRPLRVARERWRLRGQ